MNNSVALIGSFLLALTPLLVDAESSNQVATTPLSLSAQSQVHIISLAQAIQRAQQSGFDVRLARTSVAVASADAQSARSTLLPQVTVAAIALVANEQQLGMPVARQAYGSAMLTVPVLSQAASQTASAASLQARATQADLQANINDTIFSVTKAYRQLQLTTAIVGTRQVAIQAQHEHVRVTMLRIQVGKVPAYTLARDRVNLLNAVQEAEDAAVERDQASNDLAAMIALPIAADYVTEPLHMSELPESQNVLEERALQTHPALQAAQARLRAAEKTLASAKSAYGPTAQFSAQSYNGQSSPYLGRSGGQLQLNANFPIIDGGFRSAAIARAKADVERASLTQDMLRRNIQRDIADTYREYQAAQRNLTTAQAIQIDAQEQLKIARIREQAQKGTALEMQDALSLAAKSEETILRSIVRNDLAVAAVYHAAGQQAP